MLIYFHGGIKCRVNKVDMLFILLGSQVECNLFPEMRDSSLVLRTVHPDEKHVKDFVASAMKVFKANTVGPQK